MNKVAKKRPVGRKSKVGQLDGLTLEGTPRSVELCERVKELSGDCVILGFSRGKDSIATWLWLRRFFSRVIPFHAAGVPHLSFADESLDYFEKVFGTKIERCLSGSCTSAMADLAYQPIEDEEAIDDLNLWEYNNNEIADLLRERYEVPSAWCAYGISASDSIHRRARLKGSTKTKDDPFNGVWHPRVKSFYPCFDWPGDAITDAIKSAGIKLPRDYLLACRSFGTVVPANRHLDRMEQLMPEDFARVELMFPFIGACVARNEFRRMKIARASIKSGSGKGR